VRLLLTDSARCVALVKPQFEAGRGAVPRRGIVRDPAVHREVLERFARDAARAGLFPAGLIRSPISGTDGNVEFLGLLLQEGGFDAQAWDRRVAAVVAAE
jgi:23S rRNA (cytidine1920-2'-O)/16S rRNA (cytidine1409-2'-O)-methyltransferase